MSSKWKYKHHYHKTINYYEKFEPMKEWCREQFGDNWAFRGWIWRFRYKKDYVLFLLRWM